MHVGRFTLLVLACAGFVQSVGAENPYKFIKEVPIGGEGGWDCLTADSPGRRLYVTHGDKIVVVDLDNYAVVGEIEDTPHVHAIALAPKLNRGFSSNGSEGSASIIDLKKLRTITKIETGEDPDAILYEPGHAQVYVFNGRSNSATVFDTKTHDVVTTIPLGGKPESAVADAKAARVYCNIEDTNEVVSIDTATRKVLARWPVAPGKHPTGLAIDLAHHRLFAACRGLLVMMDSETGKVLAHVPIGSGVDGCEFEESTQLVFASCGSGTTTIAKEETLEKLTVVQTLTTKPLARTMALDQKTHRIYLVTADTKTEEATPAAEGQPRKVPIEGTFRLLVYGPGE